MFYAVRWKDFQVDLVYVPQLIYLSRYPWLCLPVDGEASWPKCLLVDAEGPFALCASSIAFRSLSWLGSLYWLLPGPPCQPQACLIPPRACLLLLTSGLSCCCWGKRQPGPLRHTRCLAQRMRAEGWGGPLAHFDHGLSLRTVACAMDAAFLGPRDLASQGVTQGPRR